MSYFNRRASHRMVDDEFQYLGVRDTTKLYYYEDRDIVMYHIVFEKMEEISAELNTECRMLTATEKEEKKWLLFPKKQQTTLLVEYLVDLVDKTHSQKLKADSDITASYINIYRPHMLKAYPDLYETRLTTEFLELEDVIY
jgi:hypothetical protein